jgi:hypothetical protein
LLLHSQYASQMRGISRQSYKPVDQDPYLKNQDISVNARSGIRFSSVTTVDRENLNNFRSRVTSMTPTEMLRDPNDRNLAKWPSWVLFGRLRQRTSNLKFPLFMKISTRNRIVIPKRQNKIIASISKCGVTPMVRKSPTSSSNKARVNKSLGYSIYRVYPMRRYSIVTSK